MNKQIWIILTALTGLVACKKESTTPNSPAASAYMSLTANSSWNYNQITNPSSASPTVSPYTLTSSSRDTTIGTRTYHVYTNSTGGANEYYNITGNDYYTYRSLPAQLGGTRVENIYLKTNAAVGETWAQSYPVTFSGFPLNVTLTNKIEEKGVSKTVNGKAYTDVIKVSTTIGVTGIPLPYTLTSDIQYYYAPKVGLIESKTLINLTVTGFPPTVTDLKTELQSSTIL